MLNFITSDTCIAGSRYNRLNVGTLCLQGDSGECLCSNGLSGRTAGIASTYVLRHFDFQPLCFSSKTVSSFRARETLSYFAWHSASSLLAASCAACQRVRDHRVCLLSIEPTSHNQECIRAFLYITVAMIPAIYSDSALVFFYIIQTILAAYTPVTRYILHQLL